MDFLIALVPSLGVLFLFWLAVRGIFDADRRERAASARYESQASAVEAEPASRENPPAPPTGE